MRDENFFVLLSYAKKRPKYIYDGQQMGIWHEKYFFSLYLFEYFKRISSTYLDLGVRTSVRRFVGTGTDPC